MQATHLSYKWQTIPYFSAACLINGKVMYYVGHSSSFTL